LNLLEASQLEREEERERERERERANEKEREKTRTKRIYNFFVLLFSIYLFSPSSKY